MERTNYIKGSLVRYIFHNEENLYTVARIRVQETTENFSDKEAIITGYLPQLYEHESYFFYGYFIDHPKYGRQYHVVNYKRELPQTKSGVIQYLSSELFEGIGVKTAEAIVQTLGERAISKIMENPAVLEKVPHLRKDAAQKLYESLKRYEGLDEIMIFLSECGFGPKLAMRIYQEYKEDTIKTIQDNPYQLVYDIEGIGFKRADELGEKQGIKGSHPERIRAAALYVLTEQTMQNGHVYLDYDSYVKEIKKLLDDEKNAIDETMIAHELLLLDEEDKLVLKKERVYLPSLYYAEKGLANNIKRLLANAEDISAFSDEEFQAALDNVEKKLNIHYSESQRKAIKTALSTPLMLLTGGPGTGKTTIIKGIVEVYAQLYELAVEPQAYGDGETYPFILAAPTGRAAKRMGETTGLPAYTIHRLLGWKGDYFEHNEENPIAGRLLIVDEVSMVDLWLAHHLFKSLPKGMQVILVGDEDQLPSVQPGQVLKDLLDSKAIPTVKLTDVYRQAEGSTIIEFAHAIKKGELPDDFAEATEDRRFFPCSTDEVADVVVKICSFAIDKGYSIHDVQVLAPIYKGKAGVDHLNVQLQNVFNPKSEQKREIEFRDTIFRTGDKVLQLVNDPENQVFNGDIGVISAIFYANETESKEDQVVVTFEQKDVIYTRNTLHSLTLAYCCSIHKSQGSEYPIVVLPIVKSYFRMLKRNLLYTAVTRSKKFLLMCGEASALKQAVENDSQDERNSLLAYKLQELMDPHT